VSLSETAQPTESSADDAAAAEPANRALVVDDAATIRFYHSEILRRAGFAVDEAANGVEALERSLVVHYDLILVDINMPQMDGLTLVQRLRGEPIGVSCPIIAISTESGTAAAASLRAGANLYLGKPVDAGRLLMIVQGLAEALAARSVDRQPR
jgi:two-component system chemotaxis response regulator CheY